MSYSSHLFEYDIKSAQYCTSSVQVSKPNEDESFPPFALEKRDIEHEAYDGPFDSASLFLSLPRTDRKPTTADLLRQLTESLDQRQRHPLASY
ncbi:hypothetical protein Tcan_01873 [Toxocara canis]|uniref:Uncharacterized protein n=1 Tax=Toxocara canis TaxID=6265 RepID=A0A0B2VFP7_TOXCA|nr:hypothetical protein Tcan_01873 [Toxocara canis]